jgi:peptidyl-dipeptidase Dcp
VYLIWCVLPLVTAGVLAQTGPRRLSGATPIASQQASDRSANLLLRPSPLPFQAPPFDKIKDSDFAPAFEEGMKQQTVEVEKIADNPGAPTFDNTLVALERSGQTLTRISLVFNALSAANTDDTLQKLEEEVAPKLAAHQDAISLNARLFSRIETLYRKRDRLPLGAV